jgi:hypothetical protein
MKNYLALTLISFSSLAFANEFECANKIDLIVTSAEIEGFYDMGNRGDPTSYRYAKRSTKRAKEEALNICPKKDLECVNKIELLATSSEVEGFYDMGNRGDPTSYRNAKRSTSRARAEAIEACAKLPEACE